MIAPVGTVRFGDRRGKSELRRTVWFLTGTGRNLRESATEKIPLRMNREVQFVVRVKRCGKSAPLFW